MLLIAELLLVAGGIVGIFRGTRLAADEDDMQITLQAGTYSEEKGGYYIDGTDSYQGRFLEAAGFRLTPGVYELHLIYETEDNDRNVFGMEALGASAYGLLSNDIPMYSNCGESIQEFYVTESLDSTQGVKVHVDYNGTGGLTVKGIQIVHTNAGSRIFLLGVILFSLLLDTLAMLYVYMGKYPVSTEQKLVWFGIPLLAIIASIPIFTDYVINGADAIFHWLRIESLAESQQNGVFPVRIEGRWIYGHGYANSVFYGDAFLVLPALLRLVGLPLGMTYDCYVFVINLATAWIAYISFKGIFSSRTIGMLGSLLYTLAPYRIYNIYNRCAVGEYTAITFLPLLCYGFYMLFTGDTRRKAYRHYWIVLVAGFTGIIQSHVLSCEIVGGFVLLLCLIMVKKVFRGRTFLQLAKTVVGTVLVNLWFLVPFLDLMQAGKYRFSQNANVSIQNRGILPANILYTMQNAGSNSRFHESGLLDTEPIGVGIAILLGVAAFFLFRKGGEAAADREKNTTAFVAFGIGMVALVMSTCYFPWDRLQASNRIFGTLIPMLQFPTRLTIIPTVCFVLVGCVAAWRLHSAQTGKFLWQAFLGIVCGAGILFSLYQVSDVLATKGNIVRIYSAGAIGHSGVLGGEYLPLGVELNDSYHGAVPLTGVEVTDFYKKELDTVTTLAVENDSQEHYLELPMIYYKGYQAEDAETKERFEVSFGDGGHVRVALPSGYVGTVRTWYGGMWYWHIAEVISLLTCVGIIVESARLFLKRD